MTLFINTYKNLPSYFYQAINPTHVENPKLIKINERMIKELHLEELKEEHKPWENFLSGNEILKGSSPIAQAYAGHQFGHFVPQLGDGRAHLLGEIKDHLGSRWDIQLKGSGPTQFSRNGDGRSALGPVLREYIVSEAMFAMHIPTTRSLAMVSTGETVRREKILPGGILTRMASSHIRIGTFEYFAAQKNHEALQILADYVITRHFGEITQNTDRYYSLFEKVMMKQAKLIAQWMSVGFIHGVMNTDNTLICGETIDYGPCAFMDDFHYSKVFSSIDHRGRYAYSNQPVIMQWNLAKLAECLLLIHGEDQKLHSYKKLLDDFPDHYQRFFYKIMLQKIGLPDSASKRGLIDDFLRILELNSADFTLAFRYLARCTNKNDSLFLALFKKTDEITPWLAIWRNELTEPMQTEIKMNDVNPIYIPRNHLVEKVIQEAYQANTFTLMDSLLEALTSPFQERSQFNQFKEPPGPHEVVTQTFCGT